MGIYVTEPEQIKPRKLLDKIEIDNKFISDGNSLITLKFTYVINLKLHR